MRVQVTPQNIVEYGLDKLTGNSTGDLLARAAEMEASGYELFVRIPDIEGGDTEAPTERNVFEHHGGLPDPDGRSHEQAAIDLTQVCSYQLMYYGSDTPQEFVCTKHNAASRHSVDADSHAPCLMLDPWPGLD